MSSTMLVALEALVFLIVVYGFIFHQLRYLKKDREERERQAAEEAKQSASTTV